MLDFDTLSAAADTAVVAGLSDATLTHTIAGVVSVMFDDAYHDGVQGFAESSSPQCTGASAALAPVAQSDAVAISRSGAVTQYTVVSRQPDGAGLTTLILELSA